MTKSDLLKLLETIPDDADIVFLDGEGNYEDEVKVLEERVLGRFSLPLFPENSFYASYRHYDHGIFLYDKRCVILG